MEVSLGFTRKRMVASALVFSWNLSFITGQLVMLKSDHWGAVGWLRNSAG